MAEGRVLTLGETTSTVSSAPDEVVGPAPADHVAVFDATGEKVGDGLMSVADIIAQASVIPPQTDQIAQNSFLVSGGAIIWVSAYEFRVTAAQYYIGGVLYTSDEQTVTLDDSDATNNRIDVIVVDTEGVALAVKGDATEQAAEPDIDVSTQLKLGIVPVDANTTQPANVVTANLYAEQAGEPGEWAWTSSGTGWALGSVNNPRTGSKCIEGAAVAKNAYAQAALSATFIDVNEYDNLVVYIRSKATWSSSRGLKFQWYNGTQAIGSPVTLQDGRLGFDSSITNAYQLIVMPIPQFAVPMGTLVNRLRITDVNGAIGFYLDDLAIQTGVPNAIVVDTLTKNQADARYVARPLYRKIGLSLDGGGLALKTGVKGSIQIDFAGTIIGWSIEADQAGSVSVDVCRKAGTQTAPAVPNTTTDKICASAPIALSSEQAKGVAEAGVATWTTTLAKWDSILFNVTSIETLTQLTIWLRVKQTD